MRASGSRLALTLLDRKATDDGTHSSQERRVVPRQGLPLMEATSCEAWFTDSLYDMVCECLKVVRYRFQGHSPPFIFGRHELVLEASLS